MKIEDSEFNPRRFTFAIYIAGLILCILLMKAGPVPYKNEEVYLLALLKHWQPGFLLHDWMYENVIGTHFVFNTLFGWLSLFLPLEYVGWLGRLFCWAITLFALLRIGLSYRIPIGMAAASIFLWLLYNQSLVGHSWMFETFEAKCLSYIVATNLFILDERGCTGSHLAVS